MEGGKARVGIQLGHAGRKASMMPIYPGHPVMRADVLNGGWQHEVWGASAVPFKDDYFTPKEMTIEEIKAVVAAFGDAARRAASAGFGEYQAPLGLLANALT